MLTRYFSHVRGTKPSLFGAAWNVQVGLHLFPEGASSALPASRYRLQSPKRPSSSLDTTRRWTIRVVSAPIRLLQGAGRCNIGPGAHRRAHAPPDADLSSTMSDSNDSRAGDGSEARAAGLSEIR